MNLANHQPYTLMMVTSLYDRNILELDVNRKYLKKNTHTHKTTNKQTKNQTNKTKQKRKRTNKTKQNTKNTNEKGFLSRLNLFLWNRNTLRNTLVLRLCMEWFFCYLQKWGVGEVYTGWILASFLSVGAGMGWGQRFRMQMTPLTLTIHVAWLIKQCN